MSGTRPSGRWPPVPGPAATATGAPWYSGSLTKLFACPGLRVGYVLAAPDLIRRLAIRQPMWAVNGLVCAALPDLLALADLATWSLEVARLREALVALLEGHGLAPAPSDANWVLVCAATLRDRLAPHGILVRDCASFGLAGTVRIAVAAQSGLDRLGEALDRLEAVGLQCPG